MLIIRRKQWAILAAIAALLSSALPLLAAPVSCDGSACERATVIAQMAPRQAPHLPGKPMTGAPAQRAPACDPRATCGGLGTCNIAGKCVCNAGFTGPNCNQCATGYFSYPTCRLGANCNGHGSNDSAGNCVCNAEFAGPNCNQCALGRYGAQCAQCPGTPACSGHGTCSDGMSGTGTCLCNAGYSGVSCSTFTGK